MPRRTPQRTIDVSNEPSVEVAHARFEAERRALKRADLLPLNLAVVTVITRVFGVCSQLRKLPPKVQSDPRGFTPEQLDRLEDLARALSWAHAVRKTTREPDDHLAALHAEARQLRDNLRADLAPLIHRGLVPAYRRRARVGRVASKDLAVELAGLANFFKKHAGALMSQTSTQPTDLDHASRLSVRLIRTVGLRAQTPKLAAAASEDRRRAFTLLISDYEELRRTVTFLRWHQGDADQLAPSLWKGRGKRKKKAEGKPAADPPVSS